MQDSTCHSITAAELPASPPPPYTPFIHPLQHLQNQNDHISIAEHPYSHLYPKHHIGAWSYTSFWDISADWWKTALISATQKQNRKEIKLRNRWGEDRRTKTLRHIYKGDSTKATFKYNTTDTSDESDSSTMSDMGLTTHSHKAPSMSLIHTASLPDIQQPWTAPIASQQIWSRQTEIHTRIQREWVEQYTHHHAELSPPEGKDFFIKNPNAILHSNGVTYDIHKLASIPYQTICPGTTWIPKCPFKLIFQATNQSFATSILFPIRCKSCHQLQPTQPHISWDNLLNQKFWICLSCRAEFEEAKRTSEGYESDSIAQAWHDTYLVDIQESKAEMNPRWEHKELHKLQHAHWNRLKQDKSSLSSEEWHHNKSQRQHSLIQQEQTRIQAANKHITTITLSPRKIIPYPKPSLIYSSPTHIQSPICPMAKRSINWGRTRLSLPAQTKPTWTASSPYKRHKQE